MVTKAEIRYVMSAVSKDEGRPNLCHPHVCDVGGSRYLVSTDGHRLHAVSVLRETPIGYARLDSKTGECRWGMGLTNRHGDELVFPDVMKVIPKVENLHPLSDPTQLMQGRYKTRLHDTTYLTIIPTDKGGEIHSVRGSDPASIGSVNGEYLRRAYHNPEKVRPAYSWEKPLDPIYLDWDRGFAVIMPVRR